MGSRDTLILIAVAAIAAGTYFAAPGDPARPPQDQVVSTKGGVGAKALALYRIDRILLDRKIAQLIQQGKLKSDTQIDAYIKKSMPLINERMARPFAAPWHKTLDSMNGKWDKKKAASHFQNQANTY